MIRTVLLFFLTLTGTMLLLVGCAGDSLYWGRNRTIAVTSDHAIRNGMLEYRPEGWPLDMPQRRIVITLRSIAVHWVSLEPFRPKISTETSLYRWLDVSKVNRDGVAFRARILWVRGPVVPALAALALLYPTVTFLRGPYRRRCRRRRGCCPQCGYDLTGNVSGVCPECGTQIETARPDSSGENHASHHRRWPGIALVVALVFLAVVPPRAAFGRHLPAIMVHPVLVIASFALAHLACRQAWSPGRDAARFFLLFIVLYLVCCFAQFPQV